jgi:hypothetical protein
MESHQNTRSLHAILYFTKYKHVIVSFWKKIVAQFQLPAIHEAHNFEALIMSDKSELSISITVTN